MEPAVNPNIGKYCLVVVHPHDGCQWNPDEDRGALPGDLHFRSTTATFLVGASDVNPGIQFRLCAGCARLPRWNRGHRHARITTAKGGVPPQVPLAEQRARLEQWNARYPIGTPVIVTKDGDAILETRTRSTAELLGGHTPVIWLEHVRGCYALERVEPLAAAEEAHSEIGASPR